MNTVWLRNVEIGAGMPKVVVPIVAGSEAELMAQARRAADAADVVEWRADFFEDVERTDCVLDVLAGLRNILGEIPLLFTFRTRQEGGQRAISPEQYTLLNTLAARSGCVDAVDVEILIGEKTAVENIGAIHAAGVAVVGSSHEFGCTPPREEIVARLNKAQDMGCDILKMAVMPGNTEDVLTLLEATREMSFCHARQPVVTMSMAATGVVSRLCGEVFGSAMTFGAVGQISAPGQIPAEEMRTVLEILHRACGNKG